MIPIDHSSRTFNTSGIQASTNLTLPSPNTMVQYQHHAHTTWPQDLTRCSVSNSLSFLFISPTQAFTLLQQDVIVAAATQLTLSKNGTSSSWAWRPLQRLDTLFQKEKTLAPSIRGRCTEGHQTRSKTRYTCITSRSIVASRRHPAFLQQTRLETAHSDSDLKPRHHGALLVPFPPPPPPSHPYLDLRRRHGIRRALQHPRRNLRRGPPGWPTQGADQGRPCPCGESAIHIDTALLRRACRPGARHGAELDGR